jgi:hypothetical protein
VTLLFSAWFVSPLAGTEQLNTTIFGRSGVVPVTKVALKWHTPCLVLDE